MYHILDRAFRQAMERLQKTDITAPIVDLYLLPNPDAGEFSVFDDEDHLLEKVNVPIWEDQADIVDTEATLTECESILRDIARAILDEGLFEKINIMKPFSVLMVDEEMQTLAELLLIDDEQILLDDDFLKHMDEELDIFYKELMSDI